MKLPMPNMELAKQAVEAYRQDGVRAELGYDDFHAQWYADLNDEDYEKYAELLRLNQVEVLENFASPWTDAVNIQAFAAEPPDENTDTLYLYLIDNSCGTTRGFKVTSSIQEVLERKRAFITYASTCEKCKKQMSVLFIWQRQSIK